MGFLRAQFPNFGNSEIQARADQAAQLDLTQAMLSFNNEGNPHAAGIQTILAQAAEFDEAVRQALHTAREVDARGTLDDEFAARLKGGNTDALLGTGIRA
jgi:hypothetical protein